MTHTLPHHYYLIVPAKRGRHAIKARPQQLIADVVSLRDYWTMRQSTTGGGDGRRLRVEVSSQPVEDRIVHEH